jgi:hypothetical protein
VIVDELSLDYPEMLILLWKLTRGGGIDIEPVLLSSREVRGGFLSAVRSNGIPV